MQASRGLEDPIKTVSSKVVYQNKWMTIYEDKTIMPTGTSGIYSYLESNNSVVTLVLDEDDRVCFVRAFRYPSKSWGWELPGGGGEGENPTIAAQRELEEETGILAACCEKVGEALVCNGFMTERMNIYVAYELSFEGKKNIGDEALSDMQFFSLAQIEELVAAGEINDGQTITALYYLNRWLAKRGTIKA